MRILPLRFEDVKHVTESVVALYVQERYTRATIKNLTMWVFTEQEV